MTLDRSSFERLKDLYLNDILEIIEDCTAASLPDRSEIPHIVHYHLGTGGKRLRALIVVALVEEAGRNPKPFLDFAAACEILHNATLVHDDLQDGDETRRNQPTVWKKYSPATAINVGDAMFYLTIAAASRLRTSFPPQLVNDVTDLIVSYTLQIIDGQEREFALQDLPYPTWDLYRDVVIGKTSGLFCLPLVGTAKLLEYPQPLESALKKAATHLGILFQLQDDLLDIYGNKGRSERCSDLREGKVSSLIVHTLHYLLDKDRKEEACWLRALLHRDRATDPVSEAEIDRVLALFDEADTKKAILDAIDREHKDAVDAVASNEGLANYIDSLAELFCDPIRSI